MALPSRLAFNIHMLLELPASLNFFINPSQQLQLSSPAPQATIVIQQYAILLFASSIIALIFACRPVDTTSKRVAGALAIYHLGPLYRAVIRIGNGDSTLSSGLGGPWVHAVVHFMAFTALLELFFRK